MDGGRTHRWQDQTPGGIAAFAARGGVALLPLAAIEQHGEHLPLSTDLDIANGIVAAALACLVPGVAVSVLPSLAVGLSAEHGGFAGTLSLSPQTALAAICEIGASVARAGVRRLVLFNTHGGNKALVDLAALELRRSAAMLVVRANSFRFPLPTELAVDAAFAEELRLGMHGGAIETAMMLHLAPQAVRCEAIGDFRGLGHACAEAGCLLGPEGPAGIGWLADDLHPLGVAGDARLADAALGARLVAHFGATLARILAEAQAFDLGQLRMPG